MASRKLIVEVVGDSSSLERTFRKASAETTRFGRATQTAAPKLNALRGSYVGTTAAALAFGSAVRASFSELFESQKVAAQTEAALRSTGFAAGVTADDIDKLATSLLNVSGVDDEVIKSGENLLLTFTRVRNEVGAGNDVFNQATKAALDMSVAMGEDMQSAVLRVGKALNDPVRGLTALRRVGVQFTEAQEAQIKALVKTGDTLEAQKIILRELNTEFGGSAEAFGETLPGQMNKARESARNLGATLANILTPALIDAADNANNLLTALQDLRDPKKAGFSLRDFFKGVATSLPKGSETLPTVGPLFGALQAAFHESGKKSGGEFVEGFAEAVATSPRAEAAAARAARTFSNAVAKVRRQPGTATPFLDLQRANAESTRGLLDDLAVVRRRIAVLQGRLGQAGTLKAKTELREELNAALQTEERILQTIRDQNKAAADARKEAARAAKEAAREARERAREARRRAAEIRENKQFALLGLGPGGAELAPSLKNLRKSLGSISDAVKGTFLDTGKTRSLLQHIRRILSGALGAVSADVRSAIKNILADIDQQLKDHEATTTKFRKANLNALLAGLGLSPDEVRALRARLSGLGPGGTVANRGGSGAFGQPLPAAANEVVIQNHFNVDGRPVEKTVTRHQQKRRRRNPAQKRGPFAGGTI